MKGTAAPHLKRLRRLFAAIDEAYAEAAAGYGFGCDGCSRTCCGEHFLHHTLAEQLFLAEGLGTLPVDERRRIVRRAEGILTLSLRMTGGAEGPAVLCPLFSAGRCGLYGYRPLICRLHGLPYDLAAAGGGNTRGEGCHRFDETIAASTPYRPFDRTVFFREMTAVEIGLRRSLAFGGRIRRTVAAMIADIGSLPPRGEGFTSSPEEKSDSPGS